MMMTLTTFVESRLPMLSYIMRAWEAREKDKGLAPLVQKEKYSFKQAFFYGAVYYSPRPHMVSEKAFELASNRGHADVMWNMAWERQPRYDPGRKLFLLEHIYTGTMCWEAIRKLWKQDNFSVASVEQLLQENYATAWILKEEDKKLPTTRRGETLSDAFKVYAKEGIVLFDKHLQIQNPCL